MNDLLTVRYRNPKTYLNHLTTRPELCPPSKFFRFLLSYPLDQKLPLPKCAKSTVPFSRKKIGEKIWTSEAKDFNLQSRDVDWKYDALHDPHLCVFFSKPGNRELLRKQKLISEDDTVNCTLKEFNAYRRYLFEQKQVDRHHRSDTEKTPATKVSIRKTHGRTDRNHRAVVYDQYLKKMMKNFKNLLKYEQQMEKFAAKQAKEREKLKEKSKNRSEAHQKLKESLNEKERRRMFRLKDRLTKKTRHTDALNSTDRSLKPDSKTVQLQTFWRQQQEFRVTKIVNQTKMLKRYHRQFQKAVKVRHKNFAKQWKRFDRPSAKRPSH